MRNSNYILLTIVLLLISGMLRGEEKKFVIRGELPELESGELLLLTQRAQGMDTLSWTRVEGGKFVMEGETELPCVALLNVVGYKGGFIFMLDADVPYQMKLFQSGKAEIKGGKLQQEYLDYQEEVRKANREIRALKEEIKEESQASHFKTVSELKEKLNEVAGKSRKALDEIIEKNKDNVFGVYVQTAGMQQMDLAALEACYARLSEKGKETEYGKLVGVRINRLEKVEIGSQAPDFTLHTPDGETCSMYSVKGKLKIIDFWASWCGPCRLENPNMVKLYEDFKDSGLVIISVSLDEKKAPWVEAIRKDDLSWIQLSDLKGWDGDVVKKYNVDGVPAIFVLDENNHILTKELRGDKLRDFVSNKLTDK